VDSATDVCITERQTTDVYTDRANIHKLIPLTEWKLRENVQLQHHKPFRLSFCQRDLMAAGIATGSEGQAKVHPRTGHDGPEG
jgi:hypothetical protein